MSGTPHISSRDQGIAETNALVEAIITVCDGHDTAAVLAALTTVCTVSLYDIGVDVEVFVHRLRQNTIQIKRAKRARKESTPT